MRPWVPWAAAGGLAFTFVGVALARSGGRRKPAKKPHSLCPDSIGRTAPHRPDDLHPGDFVALTFASGDEKVKAATWAVVLSLPDDPTDTRMWVRIVGAVSPTGATKLPKAVGQKLGDTLVVPWSCVWDFFRSKGGKGLALCGSFGEEISGKKPALVEPTPAMDVQLWLAVADPKNPQLPGPGWNIPDPVWARVLSVSQSGSVVRVRIIDDPFVPEGFSAPPHGILRGDELDVTRDCIFDFREAQS